MRYGLLRKLTSPCLGYQLDIKWLFLMSDVMTARRIMSVQKIAEQRRLPADLAAQGRSDSESYWRRERDYLCDIVRQMRHRQDSPDYPGLHAYAHAGGGAAVAGVPQRLHNSRSGRVEVSAPPRYSPALEAPAGSLASTRLVFGTGTYYYASAQRAHRCDEGGS